MNIETYIEECRQKHQGKSFAFLAERCETSQDAPYRIKVAEPISDEDVVVLALAGSGGNKIYLKGYNSMLKKTDNFIKSQDELKNENIRVCVAVAEFGEYHLHRLARKNMYLEAWYPKEVEDFQRNIPKSCREETLNPQYIQDIFDAVIAPRLQDKNNQRLDLMDATRKIRKLNIVAHCHGPFVALSLEKMMNQKMTELGYSPQEQKIIKSQFLIMAYNGDCPKHISKTRFVAIESSQDSHNKYQTYLREWLLMRPLDFGVCYVRKKYQGVNMFMCAKVDKSGVEGNPYEVKEGIDINELFEQSHNPDNKTEVTLGEHDFLGFEPTPNMSNGAKKLQIFANTVLKNAVINSCKQTKNKFYKLPLIQNLAADTPKQKYAFAKAALMGYRLQKGLERADKREIDRYANFRRSIPVVELD